MEQRETEGNNAESETFTPPVPVVSMRGKHDLRPPGFEIGESYDHWRRMLYVAMGRWPFCAAPGRRGFQSVATPERYVHALADYLATQGYETQVSGAYTEDARMLSFWRRPLPAVLRPARLMALDVAEV